MPTGTTDTIDVSTLFQGIIPSLASTLDRNNYSVDIEPEPPEPPVPIILSPPGRRTRNQRVILTQRRRAAIAAANAVPTSHREAPITVQNPIAKARIDLRQIKKALTKVAEEDCYDADGNKKNTAQAYDAVYQEFDAYCDHQFDFLPESKRYELDAPRVHGFMTYTAFRRQKTRKGKRKNIGPTEPVKTPFNADECNRINRLIMNNNLEDTDDLLYKLTPRDEKGKCSGVGYSSMNIHLSALKKRFKSDVDNELNDHDEDIVFGVQVKGLVKIVTERTPRQRKEQHVEKIDKDSSPMLAVQHVFNLEDFFYQMGVSDMTKARPPSNKAVHSSLRHRFIFLFTVNGLLRGESVFKAELSDLFNLSVKRKDDIHDLSILMLQMATGKTNKGIKLFGRVARHVDPQLCAVGSLGFYLMYRFHHSGEMTQTGPDAVDFCVNSTWFDKKLLAEYKSSSSSKTMSNRTYATAINDACKMLGIALFHAVHLGRIMGCFLSEIAEDSSEDLRWLGNWDPKVQEKAYSTKIPFTILRSKAGHEHANGLCFNPRTSLVPPTRLRNEVFPWLKQTRTQFEADPRSIEKGTAHAFLQLLDHLSDVVIQDAAAFFVLSPHRLNHAMFQLPVFRNSEYGFFDYCTLMRLHLSDGRAPWDSSLEHVLPGVHSRLEGIQSNMTVMNNSMQGILHPMTEVQKQVTNVPQIIQNSLQTYLRGFFSNALSNCIVSANMASTTHVPPSNVTFNPPNSRCPNSTHRNSRHRNSIVPLHNVDLNTGPTRHFGSGPATFRSNEGYGYKLPSVSCASVIWNAWFGLAEFARKPVEGGVYAMERRMKQDSNYRWRTLYTGAEKKCFSRWKTAIGLMEEEFIIHSRSVAADRDSTTFLQLMDSWYNIKKKFTPFVTLLQEKKKERLAMH